MNPIEQRMKERGLEILKSDDFWTGSFAWNTAEIEDPTFGVYTQIKRKHYWFWYSIYKVQGLYFKIRGWFR